MENNLGEEGSIPLPEVRLVLIGERWAGKSLSGNTILRKERFECGRNRTTESEVRHDMVEGRMITVVDSPGWSRSLSLREIPEGDKQRFKLNASKCHPGPHAFLLIVPIDCAFSEDERKIVDEHMKLLGRRVWRYTMVLFTCQDFLNGKTIEEHIDSEGGTLKWLIEKCSNNYHVFNNKNIKDSSQVTELLKKIDEMVWRNNGTYYKLDEQMFNIIQEKQREVAERAEERRRRAEEQRQQMKTLILEMKSVPKLRVVLLGCRGVGKTSALNTILQIKAQDGKRTTDSVAHEGFVGTTEITLVDTPGWWKGFPAFDTPEAIKEELRRSMFLCPPGPHVFLVVIDADASFNANHLDAVTTHAELLGEGVWRHTVIVFTRGDWLGTRTIEEYIEGEGQALQCLVKQCGNRYHVLNNKSADDGTQIAELLEKITGTVAGNGLDYFVPDEQILWTIEERRKRVEERARVRQSHVKARGESHRDCRNKLQELRIVMLGEKTNGKSSTGNNLLHKEVFATCESELCQVHEAEVAGRRITVIDTPGWWKQSSHCTEEMDREIVRGLSLSPPGVHAVLLVIPLDLTFRDVQQATLTEYMNLFNTIIWKHTMVLFTYGDNLADRSVEEHIEREHWALRWLVDKCQNKYHVMNNMKKNQMSQVTELLDKIEEMVAENSGQLFCPDMDDVHLRIEEKFERMQLKHVLKERLTQGYKMRELELITGFKKKLLELQDEIRGSVPTTKSKSLIGDTTKIKAIGFGQKRKNQKEKLETINAKIDQEIEKLNKEILKSTQFQGSIDFLLPDLKGDSPAPSITDSANNFGKVLGWLSTLQISTNTENQMTLNFSQTSGYRSVLPQDFDFNTKEDTEWMQ
ncbi:GTPase IMAP family member 8 [Mastacembelus armatus]|uniref:GTPase IMAP family member 8 n=1 Tax=Mastacembelus armatus TaxID=205130 RepID=UPI000E4566CF|nr:GTPase IMAP family member 8-like [Mastacembelus armatus]